MFFNSDYKDLMPPHPEEDDPSFFGLLGRGCGMLLKANLLFWLGCIPVVTIPLSVFAMNRVVRQAVQDRPAGCFQIFRETFRRQWKRSCAAFLLTALPLGCAGFGMWFYLNGAGGNLLFLLPFAVCSTVFLVTLLSSGCLYGLLDGGMELREALRLALVMGVAKPLRTVPAALCCCGLPFLAVLLLPLSGLYLVLIGVSVPCFVGHYFLRTLLEPYAQDGGGSVGEE